MKKVWFSAAYLEEYKNVKILNFTWMQNMNNGPVDMYLHKVRSRCEISSKTTIKTVDRRHWHPSGVFTVNYGHISHFILVLLLLNFRIWLPVGVALILKMFGIASHLCALMGCLALAKVILKKRRKSSRNV